MSSEADQGYELGAIERAPIVSDRFLRRRLLKARIAHAVFFIAGIFSICVTFGVLWVLVSESYLFFAQVSVFDFLTDTQWTPVFEDAHFGIMTLLSGTLMSTLIATAFAGPAGVILAIYLSEFASTRVRETVKPILELMAGIPTVAFGYFALLVATPFFQKFIPGLLTFNVLVPSLVIGIMILPYIVSLSEDAMRAVSRDLREAAFGLGYNKLQTAWRVVLPASFSGVAAAFILGVSRAAGETMIVAIAAGQNAVIATNPLEGAATISTFIVQMALGDLPHGSLAYQTIFAAGLTLFLLVFLLNLVAFWLRNRIQERA